MDTFTVRTRNGRTIYVSGGSMTSLRQFVQQMTRENYGRGATEATYVDEAAADKMLKSKTCYRVSESAPQAKPVNAATNAQIEYLARLGVRFEDNMTKSRASELIDAAKSGNLGSVGGFYEDGSN